jgi:hypothetical protein
MFNPFVATVINNGVKLFYTNQCLMTGEMAQKAIIS